MNQRTCFYLLFIDGKGSKRKTERESTLKLQGVEDWVGRLLNENVPRLKQLSLKPYVIIGRRGKERSEMYLSS